LWKCVSQKLAIGTHLYAVPLTVTVELRVYSDKTRRKTPSKPTLTVIHTFTDNPWCPERKVHAFSSFFHESLKNRGYTGVQNWTRRAKFDGKDRRSSSPSTKGDINPQTKTIEYFDSFHHDHRQCQAMAQKWVDAEWTLLKRGDPHTFDTPSQNLTHSQIRWIVIWYKQWGSSRKSKRRRTTLWWTYYTPHRTSGPRMATLFDVEDPGCPTCDVDESETSSETIFVHLKPAHIRLGPFDRRASPPSNEFQIQETWVKRRFYNRDKVRRWYVVRPRV
ncbi:hypothetical protein Q9189_006990, partial [Teloschistes chrysophthalmus]